MCSRWRPLPKIRELNIGHAIVAQALFTGFDRAVRDMKHDGRSAPHGMILGIGTDLVDIAQPCAALDRHGERFARRILSPTRMAETGKPAATARLLANALPPKPLPKPATRNARAGDAGRAGGLPRRAGPAELGICR